MDDSSCYLYTAAVLWVRFARWCRSAWCSAFPTGHWKVAWRIEKRLTCLVRVWLAKVNHDPIEISLSPSDSPSVASGMLTYKLSSSDDSESSRTKGWRRRCTLAWSAG